MATGMPTLRPLSCWKSVLRISRRQKHVSRCLSTVPLGLTAPQLPPSLIPTAEPKKIPTYPPPASARKMCKDPVGVMNAMQIAMLDPTGARTEFFSKTNAEGAKVGDILLVRLKDGDPFAGVCINIRRRGPDSSILLRNELTRIKIEMWFKIYSPNLLGIEVVQRKQGKRARRARLTYMRKPKHDMGSVQGIVLEYHKMKSSMRSDGIVSQEQQSGRKKKKKGRK